MDDHEALLGVGAAGALGRQRRQAERSASTGRRVLQYSTTAYFGRVGELALPELRVAAADLHVWRTMNLVTSSNLAKRLSLGVYGRPWASTPCDRARRRPRPSRWTPRWRRRWFAFCSMSVHGGRSSPSSRSVTISLHLPRRDPTLERVERRRGGEPQEAQDHMKPMSPVNAMRKPRRAPRLVPSST